MFGSILTTVADVAALKERSDAMPTEKRPAKIADQRQSLPTEPVEKRGGLTGSGQLIREPLQAQAIAAAEIEPAGGPVVQAQASSAQIPVTPPSGSDSAGT